MRTAVESVLRSGASARSVRLGKPHRLAVLRCWVLGAGLWGLGGCGATEASCPAILMPAVLVTVIDSSGGAVCDVTVHIRGGQVDFQKDLTSDACYAAAGDQAGEYAISVSRADSELADQQVHVGSGKCGAVQEKVVVHLPAP